VKAWGWAAPSTVRRAQRVSWPVTVAVSICG
jgi:hypothetical protein